MNNNDNIRAALAAEPVGEPNDDPDVDDILRLAAIIRRVDGNNSLGAAALAEAILSRWGRPASAGAGGGESQFSNLT